MNTDLPNADTICCNQYPTFVLENKTIFVALIGGKNYTPEELKQSIACFSD